MGHCEYADARQSDLRSYDHVRPDRKSECGFIPCAYDRINRRDFTVLFRQGNHRYRRTYRHKGRPSCDHREGDAAMKFAVIPVSVSDKPRATTLTRAWLERACASVGAFIQDQSGGRQTAEFTVFDWYVLAQSHQQWVDLGFNVREPVNQQLVNDRQVVLSGYQHFVYVIDDGVSRAGATSGDLLTSIIAAEDFDPAILAHEVSHLY